MKTKINPSKTFYYVDYVFEKQTGLSDLKMTPAERRMYKKEQKQRKAIKTATQLKHYMHNIMGMKNGRNKTIILMTVVSIKTIKAKLAMPTTEADFLIKSRNMQLAIFTNTLTLFSPVFGRLSIWAPQNTALGTALDAIANKVSGCEGMKTTALANLDITLKLALAYINGLMLLNQAQAETIAEAALMTVIKTGTKEKLPISAKQSTDSGSIKLAVIAAKIGPKRVSASYEWQYSIDDGVTWFPLPQTLKASTIASGMVLGKPVIFRSRTTTTKGGTTEWVVSKPIFPI